MTIRKLTTMRLQQAGPLTRLFLSSTVVANDGRFPRSPTASRHPSQRRVNISATITASMPDGLPSRRNSRQAAEAALDAWGDVMALKLVNLGQGNRGDILISNSNTIDTYAAGFAFYPGMGVGGDLWINSYYSSNLDPYPGSYAFETLLHELGHSLGQDHPGDYDAMEGVEITYDAYAEYREDSEQYTVMSYFEASETRGRSQLRLCADAASA